MYKFNKRSQHNRRQKRESGQGLTEYALILAFVGIAVVLIVNVMQPIIGNVFSDLANEAPVAPPDLLAFTPPPTGPPVTLTVNLDPIDGSGGNVTVDPPGPKYGPGSTVTLTAVPTDSSWVFIGWEGDLTGTTNPVTLYMSGDKTVTAKFARKQYTLTLNESGNGDASSDPDEAEQFAFGQEVTLSADPDPDWLFVEWTGDYAGSDNPATFQFLDQNMTITAVFADTARTLTAIVISGDDISESPGPGGTIQADPPNTGPYPDGTEVTLTAVANPGWFFIGWTGSLSGDANPQTLLMDSDKSVSAIFQEAASNEYTLTTIPSGSGSITKNPDQTSYTDGTAVTLQAVPDLGWTFVGWSGDLTGSVNPETITMNSHKTVTATFEAEAYTLNVTEVGDGSVSLNPDQPSYSYGDVVTLVATADPGWQFDGWSGDLTGSSTSTNITMDGNKAVTATFSEILCSLPSPWLSGDIGSVAAAGKACEESGTYTVLGSGKDIWKTSDEFHFMFQSFNGDGEIIARITSQTDTNDWAKAGVMIRESLGANSAYAFTALTPANGLHYQYRSNTGVDAAGGGNAGGSAPVWLKMERIGNVFTSYHSTDGSSWTQIGSTTIAMGTNVYFGLAVSSHDTPGNGEISTGTFTNVAINPITPSGPNCSSPTGSLLVRINYQPSGNPVPAGYAVDGGDAYGNRGNGFSYGWNSDNTGNARDRDNGASPDQRYDTFNHMQQGGTFDWEIGVPSGTYEVCLVAGDPNALDSVHRINVEGTLAVDFTPTSDNQWSAGFVTVDVVDGRITVDNAGGSDNNKINFIEIYTVSLAPAADIYVSSTGSGTAGGVGFENQDILVHNVGASSWAMYFDGSDVSLDDSRDIDALFVMSDGSILLSFIRATSIPDVGSVDDSDIVRFTPASTGDTTSGSYSMYFDGSDVNLGSNDEDIDAITVLADGRIVVSVVGNFNSGVKGKDEDLFAFTPTSLGSSTSGSWAIYFDGSDVGLSNSGNEDVKGVWIDDVTGDIYLTTKGAFNVPDVSGADVSGDENDIFVCSPSSLGSFTSCTYSLYWDGSANGYTDGNMDGLFIDLP